MSKEIQLTRGKVAIVDDDEFEWLSKWEWHFSGGYAVRTRSRKHEGKTGKAIFMHRIIMRTPPGMVTDHINRDKLDNRRSNLRVCSASENQHNRVANKHNTSGYKGVSWHKRIGKWQAKITVRNKLKHLGYYLTPELAHEFYCLAADILHGEYANHGVRYERR